MQDLRFVKASRQLITQRSLGSRQVSKFFVGSEVVSTLLNDLQESYAIVGPDDPDPEAGCLFPVRFHDYESLYFDTPDKLFFHDHRRGRWPRHKVRLRHHQARQRSWLEVKCKRGRGISTKERKEVEYGRTTLDSSDLAFIEQQVGELPLQHQLGIRFQRLTLVHKHHTERITIDRRLCVYPLAYSEGRVSEGAFCALPGLCIVEIKQARTMNHTESVQVLKRLRKQPASGSKYCLAGMLLWPQERNNRLLPSLRRVQRIACLGVGSSSTIEKMAEKTLAPNVEKAVEQAVS